MNTKITELGKEFSMAKKYVESLDAQLKEAKKKCYDLETQLLDAMVDEGVNSVSLEGLGRFSIATKNYLSVTAANKPSFYEYLKASGNGGLLKEDVNPRTLTAFLKTHLEELMSAAIEAGADTVTAREDALAMLNQKGASYFSEKTVQFKGE